jgi:hypothetical protein
MTLYGDVREKMYEIAAKSACRDSKGALSQS